MQIVRRISRIMALTMVYIMCAYMYLTAKGFIFADGTAILSNTAQADEQTFSKKVSGEVGILPERMRVLGEKDAPITMYGYSSMSCAHCRDFHKFTLPKIQRDFIDTGKLKFVFVHFPLEVVSMRAAKLSYCLPENKFYEFISKLYDKKDWLFSNDEEKLYAYAREFGMSDVDITACNADKRLTSDILLAKDKGIENFGIKGTPSFIVESAEGKELIFGSKNYDELKKYLEAKLGGEKNGEREGEYRGNQ